MKRARRKKKIEINQQRLTKKEDENDPFSIITLDLVVEILLKVPTKSVASLVLVSKQWLSLIRGKDFINLYLARSSPRLLLVVFANNEEEQFLQTCSQVDPSSDSHRLNITLDKNQVVGFSPPIRGLVCRQMDSKVRIANPSTGQFVTLPRVKTTRKGILSLFGYDPVNDVYKVLCMTILQGRQRRESQVVSEEHQVYTLGGQRKWRMIECKHPHLPPPLNVVTKGICINGILYYYAWIKSEASLISFDLISEEFNAIKLPEDIPCVVNYIGKVAIASWPTRNGEVHLWILEDADKQEWSKVSIVVPSWIDLIDIHHGYRFRGTLSTGELIFSPWTFPINPFYFISYNLKENIAKKVVVKVLGEPEASRTIYFDHVESPIFCQMLNITQHRMHVYAFSPPIRGLICRQMDSKVVIANPGTGQILTLPRVKTIRRGGHQRRPQVVSEEHQVYTLGGGQQKWRMIECEHPHLPPPSYLSTKGICINGILYYYAWIQNEGALISFDLISEEFNAIKLPEDIKCVVNYNGKIAIASLTTINGEVHIWVLEDASKQEWSKVSFVVPSWIDLVGKNGFRFRGTLSTGELIFSPTSCIKPFYFISYNLKENNAKKVVVEGIGYPYGSLEVYFNHVESPVFLSN
ncbi:F-box/kelch-repeat protein At3g04660-like isoform X2 [Raphanus sativus]|uniref:F-box/kelch-repeat protein At3g04660-like isoform X2 n=1 Tax=Raphanus sativus TaxID=3726 RepID=A0A9W3CJ40_RAPSA|nr:F-box/kelch-repeat protein At3g04660-like isoform X2 [Raphanus sativus]